MEKITLPNAKETVQRLISVDDDPLLVRELYPLIAQEAGKEKTVQSLVMMLAFKILDFVRNSGSPPAIVDLLHLTVPDWIDALVDDEGVAKAAKAYHRAVSSRER